LIIVIGENNMQPLGGFTQDKLDEIWGSLGNGSPYPGAKKIVDDDTENVMTINTTNGQVAVNRKTGEEWQDTPPVSGKSQFE
jgi:hypothetical protein